MTINRRQMLTFIAVAPALMPTLPAQALSNLSVDVRNPVAAYGPSVAYGIYRNNKKIGEHTLQFVSNANSTAVKIESNIVVTVLKVPVYRFNYRSTEAWIDGQLQSVESSVDDNGDKHQVSAKRSGNEMLLKDKNGDTTKTTVAYASNHWNPQVLAADSLFNTLTGKVNKIVLQNLGTQTLAINMQAITATHYRLAGDLKTDVWYDTNGRWVQLRFKGDDGSVIEYRCKGFFL